MSAQYGAANAPHPPELRPLAAIDPREVGPYTLAGRLDEDGYGTLYGAFDAHGSPVAVRVAAARLAADTWFRFDLTRRIAALRAAAGVCTQPLLAAGPDAELPWIATGFPPGPTLRSQVEQCGGLERGAVFALATGTAEALTTVHAAGLAYGAVAAGGVVLATDGPRVIGLGAVAGAGGSAFAPAEDAAAAAPADVFSWACLVVYAATGRSPFPGAGPAVPNAAADQPGAGRGAPDLAGVPAELAPLLELALSDDPGSRPSAESAYRGLVAFASPDDTAQIATRDLGARLAAIFTESWSGFGAGAQGGTGGAPWTAAQPSPPAAGGGTGDGTATGTGLPATSGFAAATDSVSAVEPAAAESTGSMPAGTEAAVGAGGPPAAPPPRRPGAPATTAVVASSMAAVIAVGAGGFFAFDTFAGTPAPAPEPSPSQAPSFGTAQDAVAEAVQALQTGDNYRAVDEAGDAAAGTAERREYVLATLDGQPHFQSVTVLGDPAEPDAGSVAQIYRPESDHLIQRDYGGNMEGQYVAAQTAVDEATAWRNSRAAVLAPLKGLQDSMEVADRVEGKLNGTRALHISGTFGFAARDGAGQEQRYSDVPFDLWTSLEGDPLRLEYTAGGTGHKWSYSGLGGLDSRICGVVGGVPDIDRAYLVPTRGSTACGDVRPVVEEYLALPEAEQQAAGYVAEIGEWTCRLLPAPDGNAETQSYSADVGACYRGPIGAPERVDLVELEQSEQAE
ncbi:hypothetical protein GCM10027570_01510 [Streptomonospora sediminis]